MYAEGVVNSCFMLDNHSTLNTSNLPDGLQRYWQLRNLIFPELTLADAAKYTQETLVSAKLRVESNKILDAMERVADKRQTILVDAFGGSGAFSIAAALRGWKVAYNDINPLHTQQAHTNWELVIDAVRRDDPLKAAVLEQAITFSTGPADEKLLCPDKQQSRIVYFDPPWALPNDSIEKRSNFRPRSGTNIGVVTPTMATAIRAAMNASLPFFISLPETFQFQAAKPVISIDGCRPDGVVAYHTFGFGNHGQLSNGLKATLKKELSLAALDSPSRT
jgi:16S rRNA G966 N2-methylase RsmD